MNPNQGDLAAILGIFCFFVGAVLLVALIVAIFYLLTLQKALTRVAPRNRLMEPGMVWLLLVPCLNVVWQFMIAVRVPDSLRNEFRDRHRDDGSDYGKSLALTNAILGTILTVVSNVVQAIEFQKQIPNQNPFQNPDQGAMVAFNCIVGVMGLVSLVLFIMFWVKIANYSAQLASDDGGRRDWDDRRFDDDDDDDDDYRGPRGGGNFPREEAPDTFRERDPGRYK